MESCDLGAVAPTWCGSLPVALNPEQPAEASIEIGFAWIPATRPSDSTIVAQEGGPGYPSTGSIGSFETMFGPLLSDHNLLVVDARGTGRSAPINCAPLQRLPSPSPRIDSAVRKCGEQLNHTFARAGGGFVQASDLFATAHSVTDMANVIRALQLPPVDFYGDSYGTFFGQVLLAKYPELLRSVVLDSAYDAQKLDPWYRSSATTARAGFEAVCARAPGCASGSSWERFGRLAVALRANPVTGKVPSLDGSLTAVTVDLTALVNLVNDAGYDSEPYRQLDAAARALLDNADPKPLLRLYAQDVAWNYSSYSGKPADYSDGLYFAVACTDYTQLFSMDATPAVRRQQLSAAVAALPAETFAPFTTAEWLTVLPYTQNYSACLNWPIPTHPAAPALPETTSKVPVLILSGELDSLTPATDGVQIADRLGASSRVIVAANTVHLVALDNSNPCGSELVQAFVADPLAAINSSCAAELPIIRAVPSFPMLLTQVQPAIGGTSEQSRRVAALAVAASGDVVARQQYVDGTRDLGLRGGTIRYDESGARLDRVRWTTDTHVSGRVEITASGATARLKVTDAAGVMSKVQVQWDSGPFASVRIGAQKFTVAAP